ncbi:hypothetical protein [Brevundimonas poindexterae]|uniref:hypothetical protein n=1 Tax=Brevundimonas poindexterae TaxID=74325 RepID=UPI001CFD2ECF|nr:hypothetical protein [Brevundimonas poindexterae]
MSRSKRELSAAATSASIYAADQSHLRPALLLRPPSLQRRFELRLFVTYCCLFYFVPYVLFQLFGNPLEYVFRPRPEYTWGILYVFLSGLIFWIAQLAPRAKLRLVPVGVTGLLFAPRPTLILAMSFLAISAWSSLTLGSGFRQTGDALSEVGILGYLLVLGKTVMGTSIIVHYRMIKEGFEVKFRAFVLLIIALAFGVNVQSSFDIIIALCAYVGATYSFRRSMKFTGSLSGKLSLIAAPLLVALIFFVGKSNKIGVEETLQIMSDGDAFFQAFLQRYSFHMYSLSTHVSENFFNFGLAGEAIREVTSVMWFRIGSLFGLSVERPEMGSIARMNFFVLADFYKDRVGASPSMLGSLFFFPGAGLAIFYYVFILRFIISLFWKIMGVTMENWLFIGLSVILLSTSVDALLDAVNPLSNGFTRLLSLYLGASYVISMLRRRQSVPERSVRPRPVAI